jgi:acetyl-CoA carboxylase biotin carboxyl carrier protein
MEIKEIQDLIKFVAKSGVSEVELETKGFKIVIKTGQGAEVRHFEPTVIHAAPVMAAPQVVAPAVIEAPKAADTSSKGPEKPAAEDTSKYVTIKSPMIGTFYRSPGPDKPVFVGVGDEVKSGKVVCIIEAMKLFNEIESDVSGKIVKILVDDNTPVEYDQPLFLVDPS